MVGKLLIRGMLVGLVAGLLAFGFLKIVGKPEVDRAIAFETRMDEAKAQAREKADAAAGRPASKEEPEAELVSRSVQGGIGLFTGAMFYCAALGGLFSLAFVVSYGRAGTLGPRATAAVLAATGFLAVYVVPSLKYPANPPSVGDPDTIGARTALYFGIVAISILATIVANLLRRLLRERLGSWDATLAAAACYVAAMLAVCLLLPSVDEVPASFPAVVLWQFRVASIGAQFIVWTTIGLAFGALAEAAMVPRPAAGTRLANAR